MAWHSTWDEAQIVTGGQDSVTTLDLPSLKYLLSDLCLAINERLDIRGIGGPVAFTINSGTSTTPDSADFVGMSINEVSETYDEILSAISAMLSSGNWYKSDYSVDWDLTSILADIGISSGIISKSNWRNKSFYNGLRDILERIRYTIQIAACVVDGTVDSGQSDPQPSSGSPNSVEDAWDSVAFDTTSAFLGFGLVKLNASFPAPEWFRASKTDTPLSFDYDVTDFGALTGATLDELFFKVRTSYAYTSISSAFDADGTIDGEAYSFTYPSGSEAGAIIYTAFIASTSSSLSGSVSLGLEFPDDCPIPLSGIGSSGIQIVAHQSKGHIDIAPLLDYV